MIKNLIAVTLTLLSYNLMDESPGLSLARNLKLTYEWSHDMNVNQTFYDWSYYRLSCWKYVSYYN